MKMKMMVPACAAAILALSGGEAVKVKARKLQDGTVDVKVDAPEWVEVIRQ